MQEEGGKTDMRKARIVGAAALITLLLLAGLWLGFRLLSPASAPFSPRDALLLSPPAYGGAAGCTLNGDRPFFTPEELRETTGLSLSEPDALGRSGAALALLGPETLATEKRGPIGDVKPSGWHTVRYDDRIEDRYLYNRCHLLASQLCGENTDPRNLITGTRYLNLEGMLPLEILVGDYIEKSGGHVLYRVTPVFLEGELLARGVLLEARSLEDEGRGLEFCRYVFNVQPGVLIDYADGESRPDPAWSPPAGEARAEVESKELPREEVYVLNTRTMRFHRPDCQAAGEIAEGNRLLFQGSREDALEMGYSPCGRCEP